MQAECLVIHPALFSYSPESSIKGPAENDVVLLMMEEILKDGFMTVHEPVLITQSDALNRGVHEALDLESCFSPWC
jgi:hypothetical protein